MSVLTLFAALLISLDSQGADNNFILEGKKISLDIPDGWIAKGKMLGLPLVIYTQ